jgi:hypothetical protein
MQTMLEQFSYLLMKTITVSLGAALQAAVSFRGRLPS